MGRLKFFLLPKFFDLITVFFILALGIGFPIFMVSSIEAKEISGQMKKEYVFTYSEIKPFINFNVPSKYKKLWNDVIRAKKQNKSMKQIITMTKRRHGVGEKDLEPILKEMGIPDRLIDYARDLMYNLKPRLTLVIKGAVTPPKGTPQYDDAIEAVLPAMYKTIEPYNDKLKFKIIVYPGGVMGDEPDFIRKIKLGEIQWAGGTIVMGEMVCPALSAFDLPFLFDYEPKEYYDDLSYCQIDWIFGKASPSINKMLEKNGFILVGLLDGGGYESIITSKIPVSRVSDLAKHTFFVFPQARIAGEINKAFGFKKTLVCKIWDIPSLAATGMLDSVICCWYWHVIIQGTPYYKYVTDYPIRGFMSAIVLAQKEMFNGLIGLCENFGPLIGLERKDALRLARELLTVMNKSIKEVMRRNMRIKESDARRMLLNKGIFKMVKFKEKELEKLKAKILPLYTKLADPERTYPKWFLDDLLKYREEYRKYKKEGKLTSRWYKKGLYPDGYDEWKWTKNWGK